MADDLFGSASSEEAWEARIRESSRDVPRTPEMAYASENPSERHLDTRPLAERMRPATLEEYLGQESLLGKDAPLLKLINADRIPSMMLWGPPGSGKTTLARLIAQRASADFVTLSAVTSSIKDVRAVVDIAKTNRKFQRKTILFIDEIHRFNKAQQDGFLPHVEAGTITLIGATTENPSFSVIAPLLSRCRVFVLKALNQDDQIELLRRGIVRLNAERAKDLPEIDAEPDALQGIVRLSDGDARRALGLLEVAVAVKRATAEGDTLTADDVASVSQRHFIYDKTGEEHFNLMSALHKTMRSSDPHGAIYWVGRMLSAGEDPLYVARRMVRFAAEDVGLADPFALNHAMECLRAYQALGSPEGDLMLAQCAVYLAMAPKSDGVYAAYNAVRAEVEKSGSLPVPMHLRNAPTKLMKSLDYGKGYCYDHSAEGHFAPKQGLPDDIADKQFYKPTQHGREKGYAERLEELDAKREEARKRTKPAE